MLSPITVEVLRPGQSACLKSLLSVFAAAFDDERSYLSRPPSDSYLERLLGQPTFITLVARDDRQIVGGLAAYVLPKFEQERSEIYIYDLAVLATHRRRGIATALIGELQVLAVHRGAYVVFVQADLEDAPAIALYDKLGLKETAHHFDIPVPARPVGSDKQ